MFKRFTLYSTPLSIEYRNNICSLAFVVQVLTWGFLLIFTLFVAFITGGFWEKHSEYYETPFVLFEHKAVCVVGLEDSVPLYWSTYPQLNNFFRGQVRVPEVESYLGQNLDSSIESYLNLTLRFPILTGENVVSFDLFLFFNYTLKENVRLNMTSMVHIQHKDSRAGFDFVTVGDLELLQRTTLFGENILSDPIIDITSVKTQEDASVKNLLLKYSQRSFQTEYKEKSSYWTPRQGSSTDSFVISIYMSIPPQKVVYRPSVAQTLKFAWIQYLSMIIPAWWLATIFRDYLFSKQIIETHKVVQKTEENLSGNRILNYKLKKNL